MRISKLTAVVCTLVGLGAGPRMLAAQRVQPVDPFRIADNLYFVGNSDIAVYLITGPEGNILLDTGYDYMAPQVVSSIQALGFDVADIRLILNSHAHFDHAGGHASMKESTGAQVLASAGDVPMLEAGGVGDPVLGGSSDFPPVHVDRVLADGEVVRLGDIEMVANLTPGHTEGCTSWSMQVVIDGVPRNAVFICSLTILGPARLSGPDASYPGIADDFRRSFEVLAGLGCEVFLASHSGFFGMTRKLEAMRSGGEANPFVDPEGCLSFVGRAERRFLARLSEEAGRP